jgi:PhzF family phenazine biosynthesis protein
MVGDVLVRQVDVFGSAPFLGNPVAVVHGADSLSTGQMQRIARWTNLSETTFLLRPTDPGADYRVRIFTPSDELPFAGHPTLGTCHAWREETGSTARTVVQQCGAGLVRVRCGDELAFAAPPLVRSGPVAPADLDRVLAALRLHPAEVVDAAWVDNGPGWVAVLLRDAHAVLAVQPGPLDGYFIGVVGMLAQGRRELEVRAFFDVDGSTVEDPVTGSLNASVAQWLGDRVGFPYTARQGRAVGRDGVVRLARDDTGEVWVGGRTHTCMQGVLEAPPEEGRGSDPVLTSGA